MKEPKWVTSFQMWSGLIASLLFSMLLMLNLAEDHGFNIMTVIITLLGFYVHWFIWMVIAYVYNKFNDS